MLFTFTLSTVHKCMVKIAHWINEFYIVPKERNTTTLLDETLIHRIWKILNFWNKFCTVWYTLLMNLSPFRLRLIMFKYTLYSAMLYSGKLLLFAKKWGGDRLSCLPASAGLAFTGLSCCSLYYSDSREMMISFQNEWVVNKNWK